MMRPRSDVDFQTLEAPTVLCINKLCQLEMDRLVFTVCLRMSCVGELVLGQRCDGD